MQEDSPLVRREHAERCLNQSAVKYTPRSTYAVALSTPVLFPMGTPGVDHWYPALFPRRWKGFIVSTARRKFLRATRGVLARRVACEVAECCFVGADFWRLPAEAYLCEEYFSLDVARVYDYVCPALGCIFTGLPCIQESPALECVHFSLRAVPPTVVGPRACVVCGRDACDLHNAAATLLLRFFINLDYLCGRLSGEARRKFMRLASISVQHGVLWALYRRWNLQPPLFRYSAEAGSHAALGEGCVFSSPGLYYATCGHRDRRCQ